MSEVDNKDVPEFTQEEINGVQMEVRPMTDVQEFGNIVTGWHYQVVSDIGHMINMPEDAMVEVPTGTVDADGNAEFKEGTQEHKEGFIAGMHYTLDLLNTFPIHGKPVDEPATE